MTTTLTTLTRRLSFGRRWRQGSRAKKTTIRAMMARPEAKPTAQTTILTSNWRQSPRMLWRSWSEKSGKA
jgi:hypothetical protein